MKNEKKYQRYSFDFNKMYLKYSSFVKEKFLKLAEVVKPYLAMCRKKIAPEVSRFTQGKRGSKRGSKDRGIISVFILNNVIYIGIIVVIAFYAQKKVRSLFGVGSGIFAEQSQVTVDTLITGIRKTGILKPYKVVTAGIAKETQRGVEESATLIHQYKGIAEYAVDLQKTKIDVAENTITVTLAEPWLEDPREPPISSEEDPLRLWKVDATPFWAYSKWEEYFRNEYGTIVHQQILRDIDTKQNLENAKGQVEVFFTYIFQPIIRKTQAKIRFVWKTRKEMDALLRESL